MKYFISDLHFGHKNILSYDNRPFTNIEIHDKMLIQNWNSTVNVDDDVYILGDVSWYNASKTIEILKSLNGNKHLIIGNHDKVYLKNSDFRNCFVEIEHYKELELDDRRICVLSHYPIPCFNQHYYGAYHLYGHVHTSFEENMIQHFRKEMEALYDKPCNMINVGAMMSYMDYKPRSLSYLEAYLEKKS